jgi:hypothetical protein
MAEKCAASGVVGEPRHGVICHRGTRAEPSFLLQGVRR